MKKILFLFAITVVALTACDNRDEPVPVPVEDTNNLYLAANGLTGFPEAIYDLDGNTIYRSEEGDHIKSLVADGSDWYAVILKTDGASHVVKNGKTIYKTGETIWCFDVENGSVYTVQESKVMNTVWVNKDFQRLYELPDNVYYNTFTVEQGNVVMGIYDENASYWNNGEITPVVGLDDGFDWIYGIDKKGDNMLITYSGINNRKYMYWWNGTSQELPAGFCPSMSRIVNGHAFILGQKKTSSGIGGVNGVPAVIIDGVETLLSEQKGFAAVQVAQQGMDTYILVNDVRSDSGRSMLYRNMQQVTMPSNIVIPQELLQHYSQYGTMISLTELGIIDIAS